MEIKINLDWTFGEVVENLQALKLQYEEVLASFYYFDLKKAVSKKREIKKIFYSFKLKDWQKDKIWEYMNGFETLQTLISINERLKK